MTSLIRNRWLPFEEARDYVRRSNIKTQMEWKHKRKNLPAFIPRDPNRFYKDEWVGFADWLGTENIRGQLRKYRVNDSFFSEWSVSMSYILGLWMADGCIRERLRGNGKSFLFSICQHSRDKYILKQILNEMESDYPIYQPKSRPNMSHFEINSKVIFEDILRLGGSPNKSLKVRMPYVPDEYFADFIRGVFDGDGSISVNGITPSSYICSGSLDFIEDLMKSLSRFNIRGKVGNNGNKNNPCHLLRFGAEESRKLGGLMYHENCIMKLERKFAKFDKVRR